MQTILITGAGPNGITGKRIKENLMKDFQVLSPSSKDLDLTDSRAVDSYFGNHKIDYIVHSALTSPSRGHDSTDESKEVEDNLRMYFNLARHSAAFKKMFYFGSGAEFDKSQPIESFKEADRLTRMPEDKYGLVKYILSSHAINSDNIYNLRLFGTINPAEPYQKNVVSNLCAKAACGLTLNLRRDCAFSFIDIDDVASFIKYGINHDLEFHDYNMSSARYYLSEIASIINNHFCNGENEITFETQGLNREYSANNHRMKEEFDSFTPIISSLTKVYDEISRHKSNIDQDMIDSRWMNTEKDSSASSISDALAIHGRPQHERGGVNSLLSTSYSLAS